MERKKRIIFVGIGIGLLAISAIFLITLSNKTGHEVYVNSLEEKEIATLSLNAGDILIIQSDGIEDAVSIIKIYNEDDELVASSQSEIDKGISLIFTAESIGEYKIIATLDNPDTEVDGVIELSIQHYITLYVILLGCLFIFASIVIISSSLLREQYIIPSQVVVDKLKQKGIKPEKKEIEKPIGISKAEIIFKYKSLIQPVDKEIITEFIKRVYRGISERKDIISAYAIDLQTESIIWRLSDQEGKSDLEILKEPMSLEANTGLKSIFDKMLDLYGGVFPPQIVLSFPNYYLNALVHKQVMVMVLLKPEVDWGISSSIFVK